jgi:hypothetical protein
MQLLGFRNKGEGVNLNPNKAQAVSISYKLLLDFFFRAGFLELYVYDAFFTKPQQVKLFAYLRNFVANIKLVENAYVASNGAQKFG